MGPQGRRAESGTQARGNADGRLVPLCKTYAAESADIKQPCRWDTYQAALLLFEDDPAKREAARQAAARHVLQPRSDDYGQEVRRMMREAAAFIFIYGCG